MRRRNNNQKVMTAGIAILAAICVFAGVAWPKISEKPKLTLNGQPEVQVALNQEYHDEGAVATFQKKDISNEIDTVGSVDTSKIGTYEIEYEVKQGKKASKEKRIVHVVDSDAPQITLKGKETVAVSKMEDYSEPGFSATDNCDGDLTDKVRTSVEKVDDGKSVVHYEVTDSSGNKGTAERAIVLKETVPPQISLNGKKCMTIEEGEKFEDPGASATDNRDGDLTEKIKVDGYVDIYRPGTYTVTYSVKDSSGNKALAKRQVTVKQGKTNPKNAVYLTFDDGPSSDVTVKVLDILKKNNVKATFFICNYDESNKKLIQRMIDEGHTVGIHGYSHDYAKIYKSTSAFMENIHKLKNKLKEDTGYDAFVIRFPGGSSNTVSAEYCKGIMTKLVKMVTDENLMYLDWNVSSEDAVGNNRPKSILVKNVTQGLKKNRSNVVLMHDTSAKRTTAEGLQEMIDYGKKHGYTFYAVSKDTVPIHHGVNN